MLRSLKLAVILLLVALVPARAIGSVTLMVCASNQEQSAAHQHDTAGQGEHTGHDMDHGSPSSGDAGHTCGYCAAHCAGVAFAVPTDLLPVASRPGTDRIPFGARAIPVYQPNLLDRPPLVS